MNKFNTSNNYLFDIFIKNIKIFLIVGVVAVVASVIFSSPTFMPPKYKSTAVVYPSNLGRYSEESPIEQMIQWFESVEIKNNVIEENQLAKHYDLDKGDKLFYFNLMSEYDENISISETRYESAEIKVIDESPEMAFKIVNSIIDNFNKTVRKVHLKRANEDFKSVEYRYNLIKSQLDSLGFKDPNLLLTDNENYITHSDRVTNLLREYVKINEDYHYLITIKNNSKTFTNTIVEPYISQKKVYPIRWLIVLSSGFLAVFFTFIVLLFSKRLKQ